MSDERCRHLFLKILGNQIHPRKMRGGKILKWLDPFISHNFICYPIPSRICLKFHAFYVRFRIQNPSRPSPSKEVSFAKRQELFANRKLPIIVPYLMIVLSTLFKPTFKVQIIRERGCNLLQKRPSHFLLDQT